MATRKRIKISLQTKYEIIKCFENKIKVKDIQEKFELKDWKNVYEIIEIKDKIVEKYENMKKKDAEKSSYVRQSNYPQLEKALVKWIQQMKIQKVPL